MKVGEPFKRDKVSKKPILSLPNEDEYFKLNGQTNWDSMNLDTNLKVKGQIYHTFFRSSLVYGMENA